MKIALFYPSHESAWSLCKGLRNTLRRMGHEVTDFGNENWLEQSRHPSQHDLIFVSGPEYLWKRILSTYPDWYDIKVPKMGWLHETVYREDYATNPIAVDSKLPITAISYVTPLLFTPAYQDQIYGMPWVQFGVDLEMFNPYSVDKEYDVAFIGAIYDKRRKFLENFPLLNIARLNREDAATDELYAQLICKSHVVLNLPSMSDLSTTRVFEVMACGTALVTPRTENAGNYDMFKHGEHLLYYTDSPVHALSTLVIPKKRVIKRPLSPLFQGTLLHKIAQQGREEVVANHGLEKRIKQMLE